MTLQPFLSFFVKKGLQQSRILGTFPPHSNYTGLSSEQKAILRPLKSLRCQQRCIGHTPTAASGIGQFASYTRCSKWLGVWRGAPRMTLLKWHNAARANGALEQKMVKFTNPRSSSLCICVSHLHVCPAIQFKLIFPRRERERGCSRSHYNSDAQTFIINFSFYAKRSGWTHA